MEIDYGKIITNALSTLVAAVFVGAAVIVWNAATSIDDRIKDANTGILEQQATIKATQDTILPEITDMKASVDDLRAQIQSLTKILEENKALPPKTSSDAGSPVILDEFKVKRAPNWNSAEAEKLKKAIDVRQQQIFEQSNKRE